MFGLLDFPSVLYAQNTAFAVGFECAALIHWDTAASQTMWTLFLPFLLFTRTQISLLVVLMLWGWQYCTVCLCGGFYGVLVGWCCIILVLVGAVVWWQWCFLATMCHSPNHHLPYLPTASVHCSNSCVYPPPTWLAGGQC